MKLQLGKGFSATHVYEECMQNWIQRRKMDSPNMCDDFVQLKDILYYENRLKMGVLCRHHNDFDNVKIWDFEHPHVLSKLITKKAISLNIL